MGSWKNSWLAAVFLLIGGRGFAEEEQGSWLFRDLRFRVPVTVETGIYPRQDALVRCFLDFTALFQDAGAAGAVLDVDSLRVAAGDEQGRQKEVPSAFFPAEQFNPRTAARGELVWLLPGEVDPLEVRQYWIYFDSTEAGPRQPPHYPKSGDFGYLRLPEVWRLRLPANLVRNPGFEEPDSQAAALAAHWTPFAWDQATGAMETVREPHHGGERALKITCTAGRSFGCQQQHVPLKPNALYRVSVWVRPAPGNRTQGLCLLVTAWLYQADGRKVQLSNAKFQNSTPLHPDQWTCLSTRGLAYQGTDVRTPPDTAYGDIQIGLLSSSRTADNAAIGAAYVDDVEIVEVTPENRIPPVMVEVGAVENRSDGVLECWETGKLGNWETGKLSCKAGAKFPNFLIS